MKGNSKEISTKNKENDQTKRSSHHKEVEGITAQMASLSLRESTNTTTTHREIEEPNATAILKCFRPGVHHLVDLTLVVEGQVLRNYKSFDLRQSIRKHHEFTLELSHDALKDEETYEMQQAQHLLGKRLLVTFHYKGVKAKPERYFSGIITDVSFKQTHGNKGHIFLKGYSPTILLDQAPHIQSFGGSDPESLHSIVQNILQEGYVKGGKYQALVQLSKDINLSYTCQYNETSYNFLARTAEAYGEQFFYDGETLYFGDLPPGDKPIKLVYGRDVEDVTIRMQAKHVNRLFYGYNSHTNKKLSAASDSKLQVKGTLAKVAYQKSESIFTSPSLQLAPIKASTDQDVLQAQKGVIGSEGLGVFVTSGVTSVPFLYPGCTIELAMLDPITKVNNHFTTLMITEVTHNVDSLGRYQGCFEAVDAQTGFIPRIVYTHPLAEQQIATVMSNADPHEKGRVQVQFDWQNNRQSTEWIRVMTPDAGRSDQVNKNRGLVAIPEVGDQVMISFVGNHPDRPFVLGGLFHGETGAGGGKDNAMRSFSSKSGNALKFNDGEGSTMLQDSGTVQLLFDGAGNATIQADLNHTIHAGLAHEVHVGATKDEPAQASVKVDAAGNILLDAKTSIVFKVGENKISIDQKGIVTLAGCGRIESTAQKGLVMIKSVTDDVTLVSETAALHAKGAVETNLGGGSTTNLTGGVVNANEI